MTQDRSIALVSLEQSSAKSIFSGFMVRVPANAVGARPSHALVAGIFFDQFIDLPAARQALNTDAEKRSSESGARLRDHPAPPL